MSFGLYTGDKLPWIEFAENAETGPTTELLKKVFFFFELNNIFK